MKKLIAFLTLALFAFFAGCSSDSANQNETSPVSDSRAAWDYVIFNKSDHDIVIEYFGGRRNVECENNVRLFVGDDGGFRDLDVCALRISKKGHDYYNYSIWRYSAFVVYSGDGSNREFVGTERVFPDLSPCAHFNYPFIRDRFKVKHIILAGDEHFPVATSMRITFDKGTPGERVINYTADALKTRDLRRNEQWADDPDIYRSYTFTNADYDLARTTQESALEPIPAECLRESNYDYRPR